MRWLERWRAVAPGSAPTALVFGYAKRTAARDAERLIGMPLHAFRRGMAVEWLRRGGSQVSLQALNGWRSGLMVSKYVRALSAELALDEHRRLMGEAS